MDTERKKFKHNVKRLNATTSQEALDKLPIGRAFTLDDAMARMGLSKTQVNHLLGKAENITRVSRGVYKRIKPAGSFATGGFVSGGAPISDLVPELEEIRKKLQQAATRPPSPAMPEPYNGQTFDTNFGAPTSAFALPRKTAEDEMMEKLAAQLKDIPTETVLLVLKSHVWALRARGWDVKVKVKNQW